MRFSSGVRWPTTWPSSITAANRVLVCWLLVGAVWAQTLPYIPTTILVPVLDQGSAQNVTSDTAYVFSPNNGTVELLAMNFSKTIEGSSPSLQTLTADLPFLTSDNTAFSPTTADNGSLIVYAGDCLSSDNARIWTLDALTDGVKSTWSQEITTSSSGSSQIGPAFLGGSLGYSSTLAPTVSQAVIYVYGGMCANSTSNGTTSPQSGGQYSNRMIKLTPSESAYSIETITKNTLVAEAGFTFTQLPPSFSTVSGVVSQQVQHILLGGHTQLAFVNFSTAAIWSLPEESWTSVEITKADPAASSKELAIKSASQDIDPRSGHTTILNEAGNQLIVLGGWVGDTSTAASPQLLVLEVASGYGGNGSWQWSIPEDQPSNAIYGHGAALLPGNVMMIYGGHTLSASSSKRLKRATSLGNDTPMFLNLTSMSWSDAYTNPAHLASGGSAASSSATKAKQRLGLGLGLGFGLAAVLAAVLVYFCYRWRARRDDELAREKAIDSLVLNNNHYVHEDEAMLERNDAQHFPWYTDRLDPFMSSPRFSRYESLRTQPEVADEGDLGGVRPLNITRKPVPPRAAKGQYQPAPLGIYDPPRGMGAGPIHPIHEEDEDAESRPGTAGKDSNRDSAQYSDPFQTPTHEKTVSFPPASRASLTPSPDAQRRHTDPEVRDWMCDVDAADALVTSHMARSPSKAGGRISPSRRKSNRSGYIADDDSRTDSNLSESARSHFSRSGSNRSHARSAFGIGTGAAAAAAKAEDRQGTSSSSNSSAPTYNTAKSSFNVLQAEGPSLLRGRREGEHDDYDPPPSPSKTKPRRNWLGSLRRVFSGPTSSPSPPDSDRDPARDDSTAEASDYDVRLGGLGGIAAGGVLRRKGGRGAWEAIQQSSSGGSPSHSRYPAEGPYDNDDEEWDIEKAVERRLVQVMFTVPKERLRVVNGEPDVESMQDVEIVDPNRDVEDEIREELDKLERYASASASARSREAAAAAAAVEDTEGSRRNDEGERNYTWLREPELEREQSRREKGKQRAKTPISDSGLGTEISSTAPASPPPPPLTPHRGQLPYLSPRPDDDSVHLSPPASRHSHMTMGRESFDSRRHPSMTSDVSEGLIMNAEAVRYERPRTKVRQMIETIESRSPSTSPDRLS